MGSKLESFGGDVADARNRITLEDLNGDPFGCDFEHVSRDVKLRFTGPVLA